MGASQSNQMESNEENVQVEHWREERREVPRSVPEQVSKKTEDPEEIKVVSPEKKEHNARMAKLEKELAEQKERVKMMSEKNSKKRAPCNSENFQAFRRDMQELRGIRDRAEQQMTAASAQVVVDHIVEAREDAQEFVNKLKALEDEQEESRRAIRQFEIECSREHNEDAHVIEDCEVAVAGSSVGTASVKSLYKDIDYQISMIPRNFKGILGTVNLAVRTGKSSLARNKEKDAQSAFSRINKNIEVIIQKGSLILETRGYDVVEQELLTAFVKIRDEARRILDEILEVEIHWDTKPEDESSWLKTLESQMKSLEKHIEQVTDAWKNVKIPEN